jgi:hypothetical protein
MSFPLLLHVLIVVLPLIFGCPALGMTFLLWWLILSMMCENPTLFMQTWQLKLRCY